MQSKGIHCLPLRSSKLPVKYMLHLPSYLAKTPRCSERNLLQFAFLLLQHSDICTMSQLWCLHYSSEPNLITHLMELQLDRGIPIAVQIAVIAALEVQMLGERCKKFWTSMLESVLEFSWHWCARPSLTCPTQNPHFCTHSQSLLSFVTFIVSHVAGGNMVVGAELVPC